MPHLFKHFVPLTDAGASIDPATGAILGSHASRIERRLSDLQDVFLEKSALATMDPATLLYRVDSYTPVPEGTDGGLFFGASVQRLESVRDVRCGSWAWRGDVHAAPRGRRADRLDSAAGPPGRGGPVAGRREDPT